MHTTVPLWLTFPPWARHDARAARLVRAFWLSLCAQGYAETTRRAYVSAVAHFLRSVGRSRFGRLGDRDLAWFVEEHLPRCRCGHRAPCCRYVVRAALRHLMRFATTRGVVHRPTSRPIDTELARFEIYLADVRGLRPTTRTQRLGIMRAYFAMHRDVRPGSITAMAPHRLRRFMSASLPRWRANSARALTSTLRSYLRFRSLCGDQVAHLFSVIPVPAYWSHAAIPTVLPPADVARLLHAFPRDLPTRHRGYAIVRCLVDLGLRGREVAGLSLDDIDWVAGTIRIVRGKSRRVDVLPLLPSTGAAITRYLQAERPSVARRQLFVRHVAPRDRPVGLDVIRQTVRAAYCRAGLPFTQLHLLRRTLASRLLARGSTLKEVADVLRHRALASTHRYAVLDAKRLRHVVRPWPGGTHEN